MLIANPIDAASALPAGEMEAVISSALAAAHRGTEPPPLDPRVPVERRFLIGGVADRLVPPDQVRDLWRHWDEPRIAWYQGGHLTFNRSADVRRLIKDALAAGGLTRAPEVPASEPAALRDAVG
ncbi:MAG: hypothetical protein ABFS41_09540 [Myxococcota bacterium]